MNERKGPPPAPPWAVTPGNQARFQARFQLGPHMPVHHNFQVRGTTHAVKPVPRLRLVQLHINTGTHPRRSQCNTAHTGTHLTLGPT